MPSHNQLDDLLSKIGIAKCIEELEDSRFAVSSSSSSRDRIKTWFKFHARIFGTDAPVIPLTVASYKAVASVFKSLGYKSFGNYASNIKAMHIEGGFTWTD